jgi:hypothetical protein
VYSEYILPPSNFQRAAGKDRAGCIQHIFTGNSGRRPPI